MSVFTVNQANEDFHVSCFISKKEVLPLSLKCMEVITELFKIINDEKNLPRCFSFIFYCIKKTEICLIFECQSVTFLQCLQSPEHCFKTVIIFHLIDLIFRI